MTRSLTPVEMPPDIHGADDSRGDQTRWHDKQGDMAEDWAIDLDPTLEQN